MLVIENLEQVLAQIESERGIDRSIIVSAIEQALVSACRRKFSEETLLTAKLDLVTGSAAIYRTQNVVETVEDPETEVTLRDAQDIQPGADIGEAIVEEVTPSDFGRIAAQTAKQVIIQRIREAEKNVIFDEFEGKVGQLITGTVQRIENKHYLINLGRIEAMLFQRDQIPGENFHTGEKVRVYVEGIEKTSRGPQIHITRTHSGFLQRLFELEIPEIQDGIIEVMSISREPGKRAKVAVKTNNPSIGAVGTCVGHMGGRIQAIIRELGTEKIDVLEWHENPAMFISNAQKPAKISKVIIDNEEDRTATVVVPADQLSLAIGKGGINVRLSVKLTGWKLDIMSEADYAKLESGEDPKENLSFVEKIQKDKEKLDAEPEIEVPEVSIEDSTLFKNKMAEEALESPEDISEEPTELEKKMAQAKQETEEAVEDVSVEESTEG